MARNVKRRSAPVRPALETASAEQDALGPTMGAKVYQSLADAIIDGEFAPGERLDERELAERFQVSRTPIREAFRELKARDLVEIRPRRGVVVSSIGMEKLAQLLEANCELEALCARRSAESMTLMERTQLELLHEQSASCVAAGQQAEYLVLNRRFHRLLREGTHNPVLSSIVTSLHDHLHPFKQVRGDVEDRLEQSHREHVAIVAAVLAGNPEDAYVAMRSHNARLATQVLELLRSRNVVSRSLTA